MTSKIEKIDDFTLVRVQQEKLLGKAADDFGSFLAEMLQTEMPNHLVLDLKGCFQVDHSFLRAVAVTGRELKASAKKFSAISVSEFVEKFLKSNGLDSVLKVYSNLDDLRANEPSPSKESGKLDVRFINPFVEGTIETIGTQCSMALEAGKPFLKESSSKNLQSDIAGVIGLTSKNFNGSIAICFSEAVFLKIMSKMLGEEFSEIDQDLEDGAGELLNIIFGQAKIKLNEKGYGIEKAIPTIIRGKPLTLRHLADSAAIILPFECEAGGFHMEIATELVKSQK